MALSSLRKMCCVVSVKDSNSKAIHNKQFRMDVAGSEFFCYRGVRLDLRRKPVPAEGRDARSQPGMTVRRPPVWKTPPPSTLEAEIVAGKDLKWPPSTLGAEIVDGTDGTDGKDGPGRPIRWP